MVVFPEPFLARGKYKNSQFGKNQKWKISGMQGGGRMDEKQIREIFDESGYSALGQSLSFKLWLSGVMEHSGDGDNPLELLFESCSFDDGEPILFDQFLFQLRLISSADERNCLPIGYWL
jgi:hypothetical protein